MADTPRCKETVYVREQLRYTGRVKGGFERHYTQKQCSRPAQVNGLCWQHRTDDEGIRLRMERAMKVRRRRITRSQPAASPPRCPPLAPGAPGPRPSPAG